MAVIGRRQGGRYRYYGSRRREQRRPTNIHCAELHTAARRPSAWRHVAAAAWVIVVLVAGYSILQSCH